MGEFHPSLGLIRQHVPGIFAQRTTYLTFQPTWTQNLLVHTIPRATTPHIVRTTYLPLTPWIHIDLNLAPRSGALPFCFFVRTEKLPTTPARLRSLSIYLVYLGFTFPFSAFVIYDAAETMLTRSPVPATRSPSASPKTFHAGTFHYVASSPHQSPRMSTAVSRRQSTSSPSGRPVSSPLASQSQSAGKKYVSKSTQYSPMEHTDYSVPRPRPVQHSPLTAPSQPSSTPCPKPTSSADQATTAPTQPTAPASSAERAPIIPVAYPQSPNKRRNSQGPGSSVDEGSVVGQGTEALAKRPKADAAPPKLLPQKYELCATDDIVVLIANMISELIETNDALAMKSGHLTRFHSRCVEALPFFLAG